MNTKKNEMYLKGFDYNFNPHSYFDSDKNESFTKQISLESDKVIKKMIDYICIK